MGCSNSAVAKRALDPSDKNSKEEEDEAYPQDEENSNSDDESLSRNNQTFSDDSDENIEVFKVKTTGLKYDGTGEDAPKAAELGDISPQLAALQVPLLSDSEVDDKIQTALKLPGAETKKKATQKRPRCVDKHHSQGIYYGQMNKDSKHGDGIFVW